MSLTRLDSVFCDEQICPFGIPDQEDGMDIELRIFEQESQPRNVLGGIDDIILAG